MPGQGACVRYVIGVLGVLVLLFECVWGCGCLFFDVFLFLGVWCLVGACFVGLCWCVGVPGFLPSIEVALTL